MPTDQYPAGFGGYVIGALPYAGLEALRIAAWCTAAVALAAAGVWLLGRARRLPRGDGQGGIPPIARRLAQAEARTEAISMRDVAGRCTWCADPAYTIPEHCTCQEPCEGIEWCGAWWPGNPVPVTWTERERGVR